MNKVIIRNSCIIINDYNLGDCDILEKSLCKYDPIYHRYEHFGMYYDKEERKLYIPNGYDLWKIKKDFNLTSYDIPRKEKCDDFLKFPAIKSKFKPRDEEQMEALRFTCGVNEYENNFYKPMLSLNLSTGKGKSFISISTIAYFSIRSAVITGSNTLLDQWKDEFMKYTDLKDDEILRISGSEMCHMILSGKSEKASKAKVFLCTHGTLRSFGERYGWDKVRKLYMYLQIGLNFFDEAHTNFNNMLMIMFFTNVWKTYFVTATPARSSWKENIIFQNTIAKVPSIDLFKEEDKHVNVICLRWNSHPDPRVISKLRNQYGLDINRYTEYLSMTEEYYKLVDYIMSIIENEALKNNKKALIYIHTNNALLRTYNYIRTEFPKYAHRIGIFTSLVEKGLKREEREKDIILSTTKSAGLGEHIEGLRVTVILNDPFKSNVTTIQALGRNRDRGSFFIDCVDMGFKQLIKFYNARYKTYEDRAMNLETNNLDSYELFKRSEMIRKKNKNGLTIPFMLIEDRFGDMDELMPKWYRDQKDKEWIGKNGLERPMRIL